MRECALLAGKQAAAEARRGWVPDKAGSRIGPCWHGGNAGSRPIRFPAEPCPGIGAELSASGGG